MIITRRYTTQVHRVGDNPNSTRNPHQIIVFSISSLTGWFGFVSTYWMRRTIRFRRIDLLDASDDSVLSTRPIGLVGRFAFVDSTYWMRRTIRFCRLDLLDASDDSVLSTRPIGCVGRFGFVDSTYLMRRTICILDFCPWYPMITARLVFSIRKRYFNLAAKLRRHLLS